MCKLDAYGSISNLMVSSTYMFGKQFEVIIIGFEMHPRYVWFCTFKNHFSFFCIHKEKSLQKITSSHVTFTNVSTEIDMNI